MSLLPFENAVDKSNLSLRDKVALFGPQAIAIPLPYGSKGKYVPGSPFNLPKAHQDTTYEQTLAPDFQANLYSELRKNVLIRQGGKTTCLCAFDFDLIKEKVALTTFLDANPWIQLRGLASIGAKGFTLWFRLKGPFPACVIKNVWANAAAEESPDYEHIEWRANGYSVVAGRHPIGVDYQLWEWGEGIAEVEWRDFKCPGPSFKKWPSLYEETAKAKARAAQAREPLSPEALAQRVEWIGEHYELIELCEARDKVQVVCPNEAAHSRDSGDSQTIIFTGADGTAPNFFCAHASCGRDGPEKVNERESLKIRNGFMGLDSISLYRDERNEGERVECVRKMRGSGGFYRRGSLAPFKLVYWDKEAQLELLEIDEDSFIIAAQKAGIKFNKTNARGVRIADSPTIAWIRTLLKQPELGELPLVKSYARHPILALNGEDGRGAAQMFARGYAPDQEILVLGEAAQLEAMEVGSDSARGLLEEFLSHWHFKTPVDRARGAAELLTPALLQGGFITRPVPIFLMTSDQKAAGKTIWQNFIAQIYQHEVIIRPASKSLVGGTEDMIRAALKHGDTFCFLDEVRGKLESELLNALGSGAAQTQADFRSAFESSCRCSIDHLIIQLAGVRKDLSLEEQLASRVVQIEILKTKYERMSDGSRLEEWVGQRSLLLLGAIYRVIADWHASGAPKGDDYGRFPSWSEGVNGLLKFLGYPEATIGLEENQAELSDSNVIWMSAFFKGLEEQELLWTGEGVAIIFSVAQVKELLASCGIKFGIEFGIGQVKSQSDRSQLVMIGTALRKFRVARETPQSVIRKCGLMFIHCYQCGKRDNGAPYFKYVFSNTDKVPKQIMQYEDGESVDSMLN